jgi:rod shape-determining protein MreD
MIERFLIVAENRYTRLVLLGLLFLSLQTTIFNEMRPLGVSMEVMLLLAASTGLAKGSESGAIAGFVVGLLYDMVLTTPLGLCAVVFSAVAYLAGLAHSFVHEPTWWSRILTVMVTSAIGMILLPIAFTVTGAEGVFTTDLIEMVVVVAVFNALVALPVVWLCGWALRDKVEVR